VTTTFFNQYRLPSSSWPRLQERDPVVEFAARARRRGSVERRRGASRASHLRLRPDSDGPSFRLQSWASSRSGVVPGARGENGVMPWASRCSSGMLASNRLRAGALRRCQRGLRGLVERRPPRHAAPIPRNRRPLAGLRAHVRKATTLVSARFVGCLRRGPAARRQAKQLVV